MNRIRVADAMAESLPAPPARLLSLAHLSLIETPPDRLIQIAAEAGFDFVDLRLSPATPTDRRYTPQERTALCRALLPILRDAGIEVWDVEIIRLDDHTKPQDHLPLMKAAAMLGARRIKLICDSQDQERAADLLAQICLLAQPLGLVLDLEYMVFSGIRSLSAAANVVAMADVPNLRVLVDALHWMRAGDTAADLRAAGPARLGYVQLCDGPLQAPQDREALIREARTDRLAPGEGQFPLAALLDAMPPNCTASLEVPLPPGRDARAHARQLRQAAFRLTQDHDNKVMP
ncbi:MAG TPA: sugar phosphate isomerase/epimerase [Rhizomicrobium sp.]|nr:sugar phosphate isomerase/epimerase [Rhizomicrobium sp.]